jgi:LPXTG-motif cell wall-anchored protein
MYRTLSFLKKTLPLALMTLLILGVTQLALADEAHDEEDAELPSYVDGLTVTPSDSEVSLTWDAATDNVAVTGYKVYFGTESVTEAGEEYNLGSLETEDVLEYIVPGLENGTTYYFSVTAMDEAGNESLEYSYEESATPEGSGDDGEHPTVSNAEATSCTQIEVTFSEAVTFPEENADEAFTIENLDSLLYLTVTGVSHSDAGDEMLVLETEEMSAGAQYIMTVGTEIEDRFDHAVVSGTSDTAIFSGAECVEEEVIEEEIIEEEIVEDEVLDKDEEVDADADADAPSLEEVTVVSANEVELLFDEEVYLPEGEEDEDLEAFEIFDGNDNVIEVMAVEYKIVEDGEDMVEDRTTLVLATSDHEIDTEYFVTVTGAADEAGNATSGDFSSAKSYTTPAEFEVSEVEVDEIAPEDVTDFVATVVDMVVDLSWEASVNSAGDLVDQMLYLSTDGGETYEEVTALGDITEYSYEGGVEGQTYLFKVVTLDESGNMSDGEVSTAVLPTTGPGLALLGAASLLGGGVLARRRKK